MDIHLNDTFFVLDRWYILTPLFSLLLFMIFYLKELRNSFSRTLPNFIILFSGITFIISLSLLIKTFSFFSTSWTLYPPLSGLGNDKLPEIKEIPAVKNIIISLIVVQLLFIPVLMHFMYLWGKTKNTIP